VCDHPLAFLAREEAEHLRSTTTREQFPVLGKIPRDAKIVGVFGFLSPYKGFDIAIRAMHLLPKEYHLAVFGAVHPNDIAERQTIHPFLRAMLDEAYAGQTLVQELGEGEVTVAVDATNAHVLMSHPKDLTKRIHFMGAQTDEGFARGMAVCDHIVLPYLEVGQSASGVLSIAVEMGAHVIATRNRAFLQYVRYHPDAVDLFDIGNHVELASRILAYPLPPERKREPEFNTETNREVYIRANSVSGDRDVREITKEHFPDGMVVPMLEKRYRKD
jgi:glycosyltransferase involved in cell wall biosynthesis